MKVKSWNGHICVSTWSECSSKLISLQTSATHSTQILSQVFRAFLGCSCLITGFPSNKIWICNQTPCCLLASGWLKCRYTLQRVRKCGAFQEHNPGTSCPCQLLGPRILSILKAGADGSVVLGWLCSLGMCWNNWEVSPTGNNELKIRWFKTGFSVTWFLEVKIFIRIMSATPLFSPSLLCLRVTSSIGSLLTSG